MHEKKSWLDAEQLVAIGWLVVAGLGLALSASLPSGGASDPFGPRFFPQVLAGALAVCALWLATEAYHPAWLRLTRAVSLTEDEEATGPADQPGATARILIALVIIAGYVLLMPLIHYIPATIVAGAALLLLLGVRSWVTLLLLPGILSLILYWVFNDLLYVVLP